MVKSKILNPQYTLNCKGKLLSIDKPIVMGILNATPDSFYNQGRNSTMDELVLTAQSMVRDGARILDIGGMSSRPNAEQIDEKEELNRILPVVEAVKSVVPDDVHISVDTYRSAVAQKAIVAGADIVNDITGASFDPNMIPTIVGHQVPLVCMHMQGMPNTMQQNPQYEDVNQEVLNFFVSKLKEFQNQQLFDVILDVGFGFGKTIEHNYSLLKNLSLFSILEKPIVVGLSRKSMIYKPLNKTAETALNGTSALHMIALAQGASILRAHDVKEAMECIILHNQLHNA